jgi:peroxiredoxin
VEPLAAGSPAPSIPGVDFAQAPTVVFFYKVTCPVCQLAAPKVERFQQAYPGRIVGVGQDPAERLESFQQEFGMDFRSVADTEPYELSNAYGTRVVPTAFLVDDSGKIDRAVESWDRDGLNDLSRRLSDLTGLPYVVISEPTDGLPSFRPG